MPPPDSGSRMAGCRRRWPRGRLPVGCLANADSGLPGGCGAEGRGRSAGLRGRAPGPGPRRGWGSGSGPRRDPSGRRDLGPRPDPAGRRGLGPRPGTGLPRPGGLGRGTACLGVSGRGSPDGAGPDRRAGEGPDRGCPGRERVARGCPGGAAGSLGGSWAAGWRGAGPSGQTEAAVRRLRPAGGVLGQGRLGRVPAGQRERLGVVQIQGRASGRSPGGEAGVGVPVGLARRTTMLLGMSTTAVTPP